MSVFGLVLSAPSLPLTALPNRHRMKAQRIFVRIFSKRSKLLLKSDPSEAVLFAWPFHAQGQVQTLAAANIAEVEL